jgi:hypothetical protein
MTDRQRSGLVLLMIGIGTFISFVIKMDNTNSWIIMLASYLLIMAGSALFMDRR